MSLFESNADKADQLISQYGLEDLSYDDKAIIRDISKDLVANNLLNINVQLFGTSTDAVTAACQSAIVKQNFLMIAQLNRIEKLLEKISRAE